MVLIVDYKAGNVTSVQRALRHLGVESKLTADPAELAAAKRIIFPGVGQAAAAMQVLQERKLDSALRDAMQKGIPILGICIGAQIILDRSEEGDVNCIGLLRGTAKRFRPSDPALKVPHMGWNSLHLIRRHPVLEGIPPSSEFYFVHSYYPQPSSTEQVIAECHHGLWFPALIGKNNLVAAQFHMEKSGPVGLRMLKNFLEWDGKV